MADPVVEVSATDAVLARWPRDVRQRALTQTERDRAARFTTQSIAEDFVAAHLLARECIGRLDQRAAAEIVIEQRCATCGGPHGLPAVPSAPDIRISWSHTVGYVAAAAARRRVGVDVETRTRALPDGLDPGLVSRTLSPPERRLLDATADPVSDFLALWVVKESLVKVGAIALDDFATVDVGMLVAEAGDVRRARWNEFALCAKVTEDYVVGTALDRG